MHPNSMPLISPLMWKSPRAGEMKKKRILMCRPLILCYLLSFSVPGGGKEKEKENDEGEGGGSLPLVTIPITDIDPDIFQWFMVPYIYILPFFLLLLCLI